MCKVACVVGGCVDSVVGYWLKFGYVVWYGGDDGFGRIEGNAASTSKDIQAACGLTSRAICVVW